MKKLTLSIAAIAAMGTFAVAGGDIAPVEPVVETPVVASAADAGFYAGIAYGLLGGDITETYPGGATLTDASDDFSEVMLQAGYKINPYFALEGRYWIGSSETIDYEYLGAYNTSFDAWGIYAKPMYPVTDAFDVYALLGYGEVDGDVNIAGLAHLGDSVDGFQWGLGAAYSFNENVSVFVDYVSLYDDEDTNANGNNVDRTIDTWNFGVTYKF